MTIYDLKMSEFINHLFSDKKPDWWDNLYSDYMSERNSKDSVYLLGLMKDIATLQNTRFILDKILNVLPIRHVPAFVDELKSSGINGSFDPNNPVQYQQDIRSAVSQVKRFGSQIRKKQKELQDYLDAQQTDGSGWSRKIFEDYATVYSKFMGDMIDFEKITVARWCAIANKYDAYVEVQNAQHERSKVKQGGYHG